MADPDTPLEPLLEKFKGYSPDSDGALIEKAYNYARKAHANQKRASGQEYFIHCYSVANTLLDYKLDQPTVAAGLLHDVIEDTANGEDDMRREFGDEVTRLVLGVTKIEHLNFSSSDEETAGNWRKMLLATAQDIRVIIIKLADRLHNMHTLQYLSAEKQKRIADETLSLYAPLAQRLGMFQLKSELEDLSFKIQNPTLFAEVSAKLEQQAKDRAGVLDRFKKELDMHLSSTTIPYRLLARTKNLYSIYRKMSTQNRPFEDIQDSMGARIITDTVANCYAMLGIVHASFKPVAGSFTDYIAIPKMNLYQSLHTTVFSSDGHIIEIQIRTEEMHRTSEYGIAAHWRYKLVSKGKDEHFDEKINWLRQWIEWLQDLTSPREFLESFRTDLELTQVFVFTPKGSVKALPIGSTPLDFAYAVHTEIGDTCAGAKVNGHIVQLGYELKSGDICDIITRKNMSPKRDWLDIVKTARARSKIKSYLREKGVEGI
ncbi:MAG: bifunctional (p)ppGpp synthetase/guanosine-3',5'-bis(diphosphate) 3'-pyrophosphohydrolase [Elusimicrobia bacterium]|nr:bifunctional (p)ppGpp synthetase/guanosine-3',5'-bis(diphosphate) 3'-pyrophosphohydrolase [Elusimicrobiota bacterium]